MFSRLDPVSLLISTEKLGDLVLLRIDDMEWKEPASLTGRRAKPSKGKRPFNSAIDPVKAFQTICPGAT